MKPPATLKPLKSLQSLGWVASHTMTNPGGDATDTSSAPWFPSVSMLSHEAFTLDRRLIEEVKPAEHCDSDGGDEGGGEGEGEGEGGDKEEDEEEDWKDEDEDEEERSRLRRRVPPRVATEYTGVIRCGSRYHTSIWRRRGNGGGEYLGAYGTALEAALVYNKRARELGKTLHVVKASAKEIERAQRNLAQAGAYILVHANNITGYQGVTMAKNKAQAFARQTRKFRNLRHRSGRRHRVQQAREGAG